MLSDFGAEVLKVEGPALEGRGDKPAPGKWSGYFESLNRGKKAISIDLKKPEAMEVIRRLIKTVDGEKFASENR